MMLMQNFGKQTKCIMGNVEMTNGLLLLCTLIGLELKTRVTHFIR